MRGFNPAPPVLDSSAGVIVITPRSGKGICRYSHVRKARGFQSRTAVSLKMYCLSVSLER